MQFISLNVEEVANLELGTMKVLEFSYEMMLEFLMCGWNFGLKMRTKVCAKLLNIIAVKIFWKTFQST